LAGAKNRLDRQILPFMVAALDEIPAIEPFLCWQEPCLATGMSIDATLPVAASPAPADQKGASGEKSAKSSDWDFSFHNLLSIINPLEHLPIIGTIYRAITGTHIGVPERIAGDALYGGLWGAVSGAADAAFEAITGKDFGSTILALFTGHHDKAVASNKTAPAVPAQQPDVQPENMTVEMTALQVSLDAKGIDPDLARRAMSAYRKSITLPAMTLNPQVAGALS
jgi:hypothetical protein